MNFVTEVSLLLESKNLVTVTSLLAWLRYLVIAMSSYTGSRNLVTVTSFAAWSRNFVTEVSLLESRNFVTDVSFDSLRNFVTEVSLLVPSRNLVTVTSLDF